MLAPNSSVDSNNNVATFAGLLTLSSRRHMCMRSKGGRVWPGWGRGGGQHGLQFAVSQWGYDLKGEGPAQTCSGGSCGLQYVMLTH